MATIATIENSTWGISTIGYGVVAEGIALIRQSIYIILRTSKGSDPFRPYFGSDIYKHIDSPVNIAIPNIKLEIINALSLWEPRIKIVSITHYIEVDNNPIFEIAYNLVDEGLTEKLLFDIRNNTLTSPVSVEIILQAFFIPNPNNHRYQIELQRNGVQVYPIPDIAGFSSIPEMFQWITDNWFFWGRWYLLDDRIICYMDSTELTSATLSISLLSNTKIEVPFPAILPGEYYKVDLHIVNELVAPMPSTFSTPGEVLSWAQDNWGIYGSWFIEGSMPEEESIFTDEFSFEFDIVTIGFKLILISTKPGLVATLSILTI